MDSRSSRLREAWRRWTSSRPWAPRCCHGHLQGRRDRGFGRCGAGTGRGRRRAREQCRVRALWADRGARHRSGTLPIRGERLRSRTPDTTPAACDAGARIRHDRQHLLHGRQDLHLARRWYHASKHALEGWSDCLRLELAPFGIKVVVIEPGLVETGFGDVAAAGLLEGSAGGPYKGSPGWSRRRPGAPTSRGTAPAPGRVADVVLQAITATNPKTRYVVGKYARPMIALRKWLGDRAFDRVMMMQMR